MLFRYKMMRTWFCGALWDAAFLYPVCAVSEANNAPERLISKARGFACVLDLRNPSGGKPGKYLDGSPWRGVDALVAAHFQESVVQGLHK
ncbi:MAG: hypothetical protein H3C27_15655 [Opitutaceae bacterium]|nr:hypothetical protein [Opitutaceae bacterium]